MKEFVEKLIGRLEKEKQTAYELRGKPHMNYGTLCGWIGATDKAIEIVNQLTEEYNNGWIPCSERLPEDCDNRFYMCIVENHEEDLPMFCQYDEEYGFGFWHDIYDEHTLGFVDSEFKTNEELGYEKVIAWQPVPSYQPKGE